MYLFMDLELTGSKENEIIQIGAIAFDKDFIYSKKFSKYIMPNESIDRHVEDLTGITNKDIVKLSKGHRFLRAFDEFKDYIELCKKEFGDNSFICLAWGGDFKKLRQEAKRNDVFDVFEKIFNDAQFRDYQNQFSKNIKYNDVLLTKRIALEDAKELMGLERFVNHDAYRDALDTALIYKTYEIDKKEPNKAVLEKMHDEKRAHIQKMAEAKEYSLEHYFDFLGEKNAFIFKVDDSMFRLLKTGQKFLFDEIEKNINNSEIFSRKVEFHPSVNNLELCIMTSKIERRLFIDMIFRLNGETVGHTSFHATHENKKFMKKFFKEGLSQENR